MDNVNRSFERIEHTVLASRERGDRYKKGLVAARKHVSDSRMENAEGLRELEEDRGMIASRTSHSLRRTRSG